MIKNFKHLVDSGNGLQLIESCFEMHVKLIIWFIRNYPDIQLNCILCRHGYRWWNAY